MMRWKAKLWPWNRLAFLERQLRQTEKALDAERRRRAALVAQVQAWCKTETTPAQPLPKVSSDA